jgi:hypothetical protein
MVQSALLQNLMAVGAANSQHKLKSGGSALPMVAWA